MAKHSKRSKSNLKKIDEYVLGPSDYEEIPELTDQDFARGLWHINGVPVQRGRPRLQNPKQSVSLRLDPDVVAHFRRTGRGWQAQAALAFVRWYQAGSAA